MGTGDGWHPIHRRYLELSTFIESNIDKVKDDQSMIKSKVPDCSPRPHTDISGASLSHRMLADH